jgi:hypothetical protein
LNFRALGVGLSIGMPLLAGAAEPSVPPQAAQRNGVLDRQHARISGTLEAMLQRADTLLSGERLYDLPTGSYVRIGGRAILHRPEDRDQDASGILSAKIRLPRTQDRLQVVLQQDIENVLLSRSQQEAQEEVGGPPQDDSQYLGLRGVFVEKLKLQMHADLGVKLRMPPDPYARFRVQRLWPLGAWNLLLSETLLWRQSEQASAASELGLLRPIGARSALSATSNATWRQRTSGFDWSQTVHLAHAINDRSIGALEAGVLGNTEPTAGVTAYYVSLRYRRRLYSDWLVLELRPQLTYPRDDDFQPVPSLTLTLEAYFGQGSLRPL